MPTYSYRCANCGFEFDKHQSFTEDSLIICPNCEEPTLRKVFNSIGVSFNGSGFYRNDSRAAAKKGSDAAASSSSSAASTPAPAAAPKSDAKKPDTKKPSAPSSPAS